MKETQPQIYYFTSSSSSAIISLLQDKSLSHSFPSFSLMLVYSNGAGKCLNFISPPDSCQLCDNEEINKIILLDLPMIHFKFRKLKVKNMEKELSNWIVKTLKIWDKVSWCKVLMNEGKFSTYTSPKKLLPENSLQKSNQKYFQFKFPIISAQPQNTTIKPYRQYYKKNLHSSISHLAFWPQPDNHLTCS